MIRIFLGKLGSGKSACAVKELVNNESDRKTYTNLTTTKINNVVHIKPEYIIKKTMVDKKEHFDLNTNYWIKQKKPLNVLWDEIHLTANSRMSMSRINMVLSRFISMARRITGFDERGYGHFTFIAQKEGTIDKNIRDLANEIIYHICHWVLLCEDCGARDMVNSEMQQIEHCRGCGSWKILKQNIFVEVIKFNDWDKFYNWALKRKGHWSFDRYIVNDIEDYFDYYDTLQIENMWESYACSS